MVVTRQAMLSDGASEKHSPECIRAELARILDSHEFRATPRRRDMLRYLVEEMLAGRGHELKGYTVGVSVFGRDENFDPQADPVVRLEARRLRRDLDSYYVSEGRANPMRIVIPKGHYLPDILTIGLDDDVPAAELSAPAAHSILIAPATVSTGRPARPFWHWALAAIACLALVTGAAFLAWNHWFPDNPIATARVPSLMVLPFDARSDNERETFLATGIADQITTDLSRFPDLRLYLSSARFGQAGTRDPLEIAANQGVTYVVTGNVGAEGASVRVGARLVEVDTGRVLWANSYDQQMAPGSLLAMQGEISASIASTLGQPYGVIRNEITNQLHSDFEPSMSSYECMLRAYAYRRIFTRALHDAVGACLQLAVQRDPEYAEAWAMLGWIGLDAARYRWNENGDSRATLDAALSSATRALMLDGNNVLAVKALSSINHYLGNFDEGERLARRALELNPNDPDSLAQLGWRMAVRGKFAEGIPYLQKAIARTVNPPGWYFHLIAIDHYLNGRYSEMLTAAKNGAIDNSSVSWSLVAVAQGALGDKEAAREAITKMAAANPLMGRDPAAVYRSHQAVDRIVDAIVDGLHKAGWTEPTN